MIDCIAVVVLVLGKVIRVLIKVPTIQYVHPELYANDILIRLKFVVPWR